MGVVTQRRLNDPTCCLCCHVRTGTIFIGMFHLVCQMIAMVFIGYLIVYGNKEVMTTEAETRVDLFDSEDYSQQHVTSDLSVAMVISFCMFVVTCMMLCGALKHRAGYLLPFFCLQLFDFVLSCLTAIGWFTYYPENEDNNFPYNFDWSRYNDVIKFDDYGVDGQWTVLIFIVLFLAVMTVKAYLIACVWACYKYIVCREAQLLSTGNTDDTEALLAPPAYATVVKQPPDIPTPPPYQP